MADHELPNGRINEPIPLAEIEMGLVGLANLFDNWGMGIDDWLVIDEFAMWLQGLKVEGPEIEGRNFDVFVDYDKLPWRPAELDIFGERIMAKHVYPPLKTEIGRQYIDFIETADFGVKIRLGTREDAQLPSISYLLPDGRSIRLITPEAQITEFHKKTLMRQTEKDVGFAKLQEWEEKMLGFHDAVEEMGNVRLAAKVEVMHMEAIARHPQLWYARLEGVFLLGFFNVFCSPESVAKASRAWEESWRRIGNLPVDKQKQVLGKFWTQVNP